MSAIQSMTGFSRVEESFGPIKVIWQMKSVNQRFLDLSFRIPESFAAQEPLVRGRLKEELARGSVDVLLRVHEEMGEGGDLVLNRDLLERLLELEVEIAGEDEPRGALSMDKLLSWPGVLKEESHAKDPAFQGNLQESFEKALTGLIAARRTEGEALIAVLRGHLDALDGHRIALEALIPQVQDELGKKLRDRMAEMTDNELDEGRMAQEVVFILNKTDLAEECARLQVHLDEMRAVLAGEGPVGRRLDFLCQELNRESNTICSKSQASEVTRIGVDMKVLIEKVREQVQNLE